MATATLPYCSRQDWFAAELTTALSRWHKRAFGKNCDVITDPVKLIGKLRGRLLISRQQFVAGWRLFLCPQKLQRWNWDELSGLLKDAQQQVTANERRLSPQEQATIELLLSRGISPQKLSARFGQPVEALFAAEPRDARQVEEWVDSKHGKEGQHA